MRPVRAEKFSFEGKEYQLLVWTADEITYTAAAFLDGTQASLTTYSVNTDVGTNIFGKFDNAIAYLMYLAREDIEQKKAERWMEIAHEQSGPNPRSNAARRAPTAKSCLLPGPDGGVGGATQLRSSA